MSQASNPYTLAAGELSAVRQMLSFQKVIGRDVVPSPSYEVVSNFMHGLDALSAAYPSLGNPNFKEWVDQIFTALIATNTCHQCGFADLFVAYHYGVYVGSIGGLDRRKDGSYVDYVPPGDGYNYYVAFSKGLQDVDNPDRYLGPWRDWGSGSKKDWAPAYPQSPPPWLSAVNAVFTSWGDNPPATLIDKGNGEGYYERVPAFEAKLVSIGWTDFDKVRINTAGVWQAQADTAKAMLAPDSLDGAAYFFFLHLLAGLITSAGEAYQLAQRIVTAEAGSPEYPNDTFANQLVYLSLMYLADPLGAFGWNNQQLQIALKDLEGVIVDSDPASAVLLSSLQQHRKILYSDASYPMQDPYNPNVGFNQRKTDTLFALDKARKKLRSA